MLADVPSLCFGPSSLLPSFPLPLPCAGAWTPPVADCLKIVLYCTCSSSWSTLFGFYLHRQKLLATRYQPSLQNDSSHLIINVQSLILSFILDFFPDRSPYFSIKSTIPHPEKQNICLLNLWRISKWYVAWHDNHIIFTVMISTKKKKKNQAIIVLRNNNTAFSFF